MSLNFFKNLNNAKINPATQETLAQVHSNTADIDTKTATLATNTATFATGTTTLAANAANIPVKHNTTVLNSMPVTVANNQTVSVFGKMKFDTSTTLIANAADPLFYLRKIVKQLESKATMDSAKRQRVYADGISNSAIQLSTGLSPIAGYDQKMYQYSSRNAFARGIRKGLKFS